MNRHLLAFGMALGLCACAATASNESLVSRAIFDLSCGADRLQFYEIDSRTRAVRGCGRKATYIESCDGDRYSMFTQCTWVLNHP